MTNAEPISSTVAVLMQVCRTDLIATSVPSVSHPFCHYEAIPIYDMSITCIIAPAALGTARGRRVAQPQIMFIWKAIVKAFNKTRISCVEHS
jgi:hypothetical protein